MNTFNQSSALKSKSILKNYWPFKSNPEALDRMSTLFIPKEFPMDVELVTQNQISKYVFLLLEGECKVTWKKPNHKSQGYDKYVF